MDGDEQNSQDANETRRAKRVTASEVAEAAGVSRSAVSRAFSPDAYLDKDKRSIILSTALKLGYRPNALAASLHGASANLVGVIAGDLDNHYDAEFTGLLIARLNAAHKWPLMIGGSSGLDEQTILSALSYPLDALIIRGGSIHSSLIEHCAKLSIPIIFSGHVVEEPFIDCVCCRNAQGSAKAVETLIKKGRRSVGYISGPDTRSSANDRLVGAILELERNGLDLIAKHHSDFSYKGGYRAAETMLATHDLDAIICANDAMALGALSASRHTLGKTIPDDLSIVGFDDIAMASWAEFDLTTMQNPLEQTVTEILRLLEARLEAPDKASEVVMIDPILMERGTH